MSQGFKKMYECIIPNCIDCTVENKLLFAVPSNIIKRDKWIRAINTVYPNIQLPVHFFVCENHFKYTDFVEERVDYGHTEDVMFQVAFF